MTSAGRPMRAKEVAQALGEPQARGRVEATRARLKKLVAAGWLTQAEPGPPPSDPAATQARTSSASGLEIPENTKSRPIQMIGRDPVNFLQAISRTALGGWGVHEWVLPAAEGALP
ncbi:hypothetical protein ACQEVF_25765 [Nonomuraea polychroma]|uniref:hypothetical protein n=1 Tax=Nonomuraea polychroma TaxID=46176 RepID=UPI003D8F800B